jgi:hypothetical protein
MLSREETIEAFGIQWGYTMAFWGPSDMQEKEDREQKERCLTNEREAHHVLCFRGVHSHILKRRPPDSKPLVQIITYRSLT